MTRDTVILNAEQMQKILPQRYPLMMIDRVTEFEKGKRLVAIKNITANEWPFWAESRAPDPGPQGTIYPMTLLIEAAAQAALLLYQLSMVKEGEHPRYILGRVKAEFFGDVGAGDEVEVRADADKMLLIGGYSNIEIFCSQELIVKVFIVYKVNWLNNVA